MRSPAEDHNQGQAKKGDHHKKQQQLRRPCMSVRGIVAWIEIEHQAILKASTRLINPANSLRDRRLRKDRLASPSPIYHATSAVFCGIGSSCARAASTVSMLSYWTRLPWLSQIALSHN